MKLQSSTKTEFVNRKIKHNKQLVRIFQKNLSKNNHEAEVIWFHTVELEIECRNYEVIEQVILSVLEINTTTLKEDYDQSPTGRIEEDPR